MLRESVVRWQSWRFREPDDQVAPGRKGDGQYARRQILLTQPGKIKDSRTRRDDAEPIDAAFEKFKALVIDVAEHGYWDSVKSEADTRMKVIDRIVDVLGWPVPQIHLESTAGKGLIDYRCTIEDLNRLIIEAKKEGRDLGINEDHALRFFNLNGAVFSTEAAKEGIDQAIFYCAHKGAELACVTNGRQWAIFRGAKGPDGHDILEGQACVFGSLEVG